MRTHHTPARLVGALCAALLCACTTEPTTSGPGEALTMTQEIELPAQTTIVFDRAGCTTLPGPMIAMRGTMRLEGVGVRVTFENNLRGTHTDVVDVVADVALVSTGTTVDLTGATTAGAGTDPHLSFQFFDESGLALTDEIAVGRCADVSWPAHVTVDLRPLAALATAVVSECTNAPGPFIHVGGSLELPGVSARLFFRAADGTLIAVRDVAIVPAPYAIEAPKQPVLGGAGGNPLVTVQFIDARHQPVGTAMELGRCISGDADAAADVEGDVEAEGRH